MDGERPTAIGYPKTLAGNLVFEDETSWPAGLYRLVLTVRPSHTSNRVAWHGGLRVLMDEEPVGDLRGVHCSREHAPEKKTFRFVREKAGPLSLALQAYVDGKVFEEARVDDLMKTGGPKVPDMQLTGEDEEGPDESGIAFVARPSKAFYYALERAEVEVLSRSGHVTDLTVNKVRYEPGEMLRGNVVVRDIGGKGGSGILTLYLEHEVDSRTKVKAIPVQLTQESQKIEFEVPLPRRELGYALSAAFASADGSDRSEAREYFNITDNCYRVAIFAAHTLHHGYTIRNEQHFRRVFDEAREQYANCMEFFAWAEDDLIEMSPEDDFWFSGQTCYQQSKVGLKKVSQIAHEHGISMVTYGKFLMTGYPGWETAYAYPNDHLSQYAYAPGMWAPVNVRTLDRLRYKEFVPLTWGPPVSGGLFQVAWQMWPSLRGIRPDRTPRMVRAAAEELMRSIEMFGWDAIRWDGHMAAGWSHGGASPDQYKHRDARETQTLVRYFKDAVAARHPKFRHGYNYLHTQASPSYDWAYEDFELDELARDGGLLMNEAVKMAAGQTYEWVVRNLQVQGDLARERNGFLLFCSFASPSERDALAEKILYFAGGARLYFARDCMDLHRYATRYSRYCFDETLRRLAKPQGILKPSKKTALWWKPFVYETVAEGGWKQLVVNLINLPRDTRVVAERAKKTDLRLNPGTEPFEFIVTLPETYGLVKASVIDPFTLEVTSSRIAGNRVAVPGVNLWSVLILDLAVKEGTRPLWEQWGPPKTLGVPRKGLEGERTAPVVLDLEKPVANLNNQMARLFPTETAKLFKEAEGLTGLNWEQRNQVLRQRREESGNRAKKLLTLEWWQGGSLEEDFALKDKEKAFGDLSPRRNGITDIYYARNMMDEKLRLYESFARLDRLRVHESLMAGQCLRAGTGHVLEGGVQWRQFPDYDLLVFVDIPHCAIGAENSYALVEYVKAGGAALFTGGEYAFGKGVYLDTVLDRELLPFACVDLWDTRYAVEPLRLEPGRDFGELGVKADFTTKPAVWGWNEVALREGEEAKVFLKAGNRPILIAHQLGKGRVACLLATYRGRSEGGVAAFFDWSDWPQVQAALLRWLTPEAAKPGDPRRRKQDAERIEQIREELEQSVAGDLFAEEKGDGPEDELGPGSGGKGRVPARTLDDATLKRRVELIQEILEQDKAEATSALIAEQLARVANLPFDLRGRMIDFVRVSPPRELTAIADRCARSEDAGIRGIGCQFLATTDSPSFARLAQAGPELTDTEVGDRGRYVSLAALMYTEDDLRDVGARLVREWNETETGIKERYTENRGFSQAAPEQPCLDSESLLCRIGWLGYMTRWESRRYAAQFAREWAMVAQYEEYCLLSMSGAWRGMETASPSERTRIKETCKSIASLKLFFARMGEVAEPQLRVALRSHPEEVAAGFASVGFILAAKRGINFLGQFPATETRTALVKLKTARQPALASFALARLGQFP